jgi:hypothetical protein
MIAPSAIVTLTTDYGTADGYAGALKGRILTIAPRAQIHDVTHEIAPHDVLQGAWCLRRAAPRFPPGTIHLAVVDPGVGSWRSGIVVETEHFLLVGPDNGVLSLAAHEDGVRRVIEIHEQTRHWRKSASFDGLTVFAPVAAHLAAGMALDAVGQDADDLVSLPEPRARRAGQVLEALVVLSDRFGNAITNVERNQLEPGAIERVLLPRGVEARPCDHYAQLAGSGRVGAFWNGDGLLELALFQESIALKLGLKPGDPVRVILKAL